MNSLQELNTFGSEALDVLDNRPSGVKFNREYPLTAQDQTFTAVVNYPAGQTFQPISPGIEIVEIINYQTANVRYSITIVPGPTTPLTGSAILITPALPSGASSTTVGNTTTISGIHSVSDWDQVKNFTWQLPNNFNSFPLWYLEVSIIYYDSALAQDVSKSWVVYDDRFYYITELEAQATITAIIGVNSPNNAAALSGAATAICDTRVIVNFASSMSASAAFTSDVNVNVDYLAATGSLSGTIKFTADLPVSMGATASLTCNAHVPVTSLFDRTVYANIPNNLFWQGNFAIVSTPNPTDYLDITISSPAGYFTPNSAIGLPIGPYNIIGTAATVNAWISSSAGFPVFWPTPNLAGTSTITWTQSRNGVLELTRTFNVTILPGLAETTTQTFNTVGTSTWTPTPAQVYYNSADILIVGGGGGGSHTAGGGGGQVRLVTNVTFQFEQYNITIGAGGAAGTNYTFDANNPPAVITAHGSDGLTSQISNSSLSLYHTALGGQGGRAIYTRTSTSPIRYDNINVSGGSSPGYVIPGSSNGTQAGASVIGNYDSIPSINPFLYIEASGGGAGAGSTTNSATGGNGYQWTGTHGNNQYYGGGGGGAYGFYNAAGGGGAGGGGAGSSYAGIIEAQPGTANKGGGGGGGRYYNVSNSPIAYSPGAGGSGVIIIKWRGSK